MHHNHAAVHYQASGSPVNNQIGVKSFGVYHSTMFMKMMNKKTTRP